MAVGDITHANVDGVLLTNALVTEYTVPASKQMIAIEIVLCNTDTTTTYYPTVEFIESGGSAAGGKIVLGPASAGSNGMLPGEHRVYTFNPMLDAGDFIQAKADTGAKISFRAGITLKGV